MSEIFIKRYDAVDRQKNIVDDSFHTFIETISNDLSKGHVLTVTAKLEHDDPLSTLFEGGGIGKTKVLEQMYGYYSEHHDKHMPIPIIDMFDETTTFLVWSKIMANLLSLLNTSKAEASALFPNSMNFLNSIEANQDNIADDLSKKALKYFNEDIEKNKEKIQLYIKKSKPNILFIDAFEYVDKEIKSLLDNFYHENSPLNVNNKNGIIEARIKRFQHYNFSLLDDLKNNKKTGILDLLLKIGVSIVVSGRVIKGFEQFEITTACKIGYLQKEEVIEFIEKVEKITPDQITKPEIYEDIELLTKNRPILLDVFFQLVKTRKGKLEKQGIDATIEEIIQQIIREQALEEDSFEKLIFSELHKQTDTILTSAVLYYMSIAQYGVSRDILMDFCGLQHDDYDFEELIIALSNWTYTKTMSYYRKLTDKEAYIKDFLDKIGIKASEVEYRLHDEMVDLIIKHYWSNEEKLILLQKIKYLNKIIDAYRKHYLKGESNEQTRKRLREYLEYKLELADAENLSSKETTYFDATVSELAFRYSSSIDEFPDHAERILNKASYFFNNKPFTTHKARILLLMVDHFLTISNYKAAKENINLFEESFNKLIDPRGQGPKEIEPEWEAIRAVLFAHKAQLNIWLGKIRSSADPNEESIEKTKEYLQKSSRLAYRTGARATLAWTAHLWGWLYQRKGEFLESMNWHKKALNAAIASSNELLQFQGSSGPNFEVSYQLGLLSKIIGRALGNMVFTHKESGEIEESLFISNLLLFFLSKQKNDSREEVRALIGNFLSNILWGSSLENTEKVNAMLKKIGDYEDTNLQMSMAIVTSTYLYKKIGINTYANYYLPEEFRDAVNKLSNEGKSLLEESKMVLEDSFKGLKIAEPAGKNLNYARACYQYGKACLVSSKNGEIQFDAARKSFENAKLISEEIGYKYLELEAIEALFTLSYLCNNTDDIHEYRKQFKATFFSYLLEWESQAADIRIEKFDEKINSSINLDELIYKDVLTKFFTTEGNIIFNDKMLDTEYKDDSGTWQEWKDTVKTAFSFFSKMLHYAYLHNENRYTLSLNILYKRLEKIVKKKEKNLINDIKFIFNDSNSTYSIRDTDFIKFSDLLWDLMNLELSIPAVPIKNEQQLADQRAGENHITSGIADLDARGQFQKSLILVRSLLNHRLYNFNINNNDSIETPYKETVLNDLAEGIAIASFNLCYNLLLNNKGDEIKGVVSKFNGNEKLLKILPEEQIAALKAGLNIMQLTSTYRNQEFWTIERYLEGELTFFKKTKTIPDRKIMDEFEASLNDIIDYCMHLEKAKKIHQNQYYYLRLLSECCIRLGEFCMIFDIRFAETSSPSFTEKLEKMFEKLIDPSNKDKHWWDNPMIYINEHIEHFGKHSAAFYLSYAYHLSKFAARSTNDYRRTAYCLEAIGNIYYLEGKFKSKADGIPATIKYLCLNDVTKKEFDTDKIRPYENDRLKDKYIAEKDFKHPIILAYMKIVEGDYIFSQLFQIDKKSYEDSNVATDSKKQLQGKLKLPTFSLKNELEGQTDTEKCRMKVRKMVLHYLKSLNLFAMTPYRTFTYKNMVLELERRLLLMPDDDHILSYIEEDMNTIWLNFNNLKDREDSLERLVTLIKVRRLSLAITPKKVAPTNEGIPQN